MDIEKIPRQIWLDLISGKINCEFEYLALKILLARTKLLIAKNSSPESYQKCADELIELFTKSQKSPRLKVICGR